MKIEIVYNKQTKAKIRKDYLEMFRNWFNNNKEVWILGRELEFELKITSVRTYINKLRNEGMPIISNTQTGYKYTTNKKEIQKCYMKLEDRAVRAMTAAQKMRKHLEK